MGNEARNAISSQELTPPVVSQTNVLARLVPGAAVIFLLTFAAYWPVLRGQFIWDDPLLVEKNPLVTHTLNLRSVWFQTDFPLTVVAFWLEWLCWGKSAAGYHTVNILLHALNSVLVWRVLTRLNIRGAWLAGAIFAVHPVCAASVAWISELKNTLSLPFFLLSIWFYLRRDSPNTEHATRNRPHVWYALSLIAFLLALLAKTSTVMLPLVLLGCTWWLRGHITKQDWLRTAPFFALALAFGLMSIWFQTHQTFTTGKVQTENFFGRLAGAGMAVWFYLAKALLPLNLNLIYPRWNVNAAAPLSYLPVLLLCGAFLLCWKFRRSRGRPVLFGLGYFVVNLFPVLGFFDMYFLAISRVSDHFQYLPLVGFVGLVASAIYSGVQRIRVNRAELWINTTLLIALAFLTVQRAKVMATDETLWRDTLTKNSAAWPAHNNLGCILAEQNRFDEAITHFRSSLLSNSNNAQARCNLGKALTQQRKLTEAEAELRTAVALKPQEPEFHRSLAYALGGQGKSEEALGQLRQAADLDQSAVGRLELASMLQWILATSSDDSVRNGTEAFALAEKACQETQYQDAMTMGTLAAAYAEAGRFSDAVATAEKAANLATAAGNSRFAAINTQLMQLYRSGKPFHENAPASRRP